MFTNIQAFLNGLFKRKVTIFEWIFISVFLAFPEPEFQCEQNDLNNNLNEMLYFDNRLKLFIL